MARKSKGESKYHLTCKEVLWTLVIVAVMAGAAAFVMRGQLTGVISKAYDAVTYSMTHYDVATTVYKEEQSDGTELLVDDRLEDKRAPAFDATAVHPDSIDPWKINLSSAIIKLDSPLLTPEDDALMTLYPSYRQVFDHAKKNGWKIIPSVNLIAGKSKQVDDGVYAALDEAYYGGLEKSLKSHVALMKALYEKSTKGSDTADFLAAGLSLAGENVPITNHDAAKILINNVKESPPLGFYSWNKTLEKVWYFMRFFQKEFRIDDPIPNSIAKILAHDAALRKDYTSAVTFYYRLTNPKSPKWLDLNDLISSRAGEKVAVFPPSGTREVILMEHLFPSGLPKDVNVMSELIKCIRKRNVDLTPGNDSGWYDYQVYALETLLAPERAPEANKLMLTKHYKERLIGAFKALLAKNRETHVCQVESHGLTAAVEPPKLAPHLRLEPCCTLYLRYARSYAFLLNFLKSTIGDAALKKLHGLSATGSRKESLVEELTNMQDLYYGFYILAAQDIGMKPILLKGEKVDRLRCSKMANKWLANAFEDPDLAVDTRIIVPFSVGQGGRSWANLGVRMAKLSAEFARPPQVMYKGGAYWQVPQIQPANYLIPIEEFAEMNLGKPLQRNEFRSLCDQGKTKEGIVRLVDERQH